MRYIPPLSSLTRDLVFGSEQGTPWVRMRYEDFENLLRQVLQAVEIDEDWYCRTYPDVEQAIRAGALHSAHEHFVASGYFEGRLPQAVEVDEEWYFKAYPDIAEAVRLGAVASARQHFIEFGYAEGRRPGPGCVLPGA